MTPITPRRATVAAAAVAALAGIAATGTFAGADSGSGAATPRAAATSQKKAKAVRTGPRGLRGPRGLPGPRGFAAQDVARSLSLNWASSFSGKDTTATDVPDLGRLLVTCNPVTRELRITPTDATRRTVLTADVYSAANAVHQRVPVTGGAPITLSLPVSGMVTGVLSSEPITGDGGASPHAPATFTLAIESKSNADPADPKDSNYCYVSAQVLQADG